MSPGRFLPDDDVSRRYFQPIDGRYHVYSGSDVRRLTEGAVDGFHA